jgi:hypothetical protein
MDRVADRGGDAVERFGRTHGEPEVRVRRLDPLSTRQETAAYHESECGA